MTDDRETESMANLGIIGAGVMGSAIAQVAARSGYNVVIVETTDDVLDAGLARVTAGLDRLVTKGKLTDESRDSILARIEGSTDNERLSDCDLVFECVSEDRETKIRVLRDICEAIDPDCVIATNTSSMSITELASQCTNPQRVIGMHFFNPATKRELVEIVPGRTTSDDVVAFAAATAMQLGKKPIIVSDSPGFVVNRLMMPMINEAIFTLNEGVASAEEIDAAMRLGAQHPMGPLEAADLIGLDVVLTTMESMHRTFGDDKYRPAPLLRQMVSGGQLGRKSGQGFYSYESGAGR